MQVAQQHLFSGSMGVVLCPERSHSHISGAGCGSDNQGFAPIPKGLVLLVFTVFKIGEKEFYIMDFKLGFEKLLLSWGLFDELYP